MKYLKRLNESIKEDSEIMKISFHDSLDMTQVSVSDKEFQQLKRYFKQYPSLSVRHHYRVINGQEVEYVGVMRGTIGYMIIRKYDDDWWVVSKARDGWKCDQLHGLIKFLEQACSKLTRKTLDQVEMDEREKAEKARIADLRRDLEWKVRTMSVEELEKWSKKILG